MRLNPCLAALLFGSTTAALAIALLVACLLIMPRFFAFEEKGVAR